MYDVIADCQCSERGQNIVCRMRKCKFLRIVYIIIYLSGCLTINNHRNIVFIIDIQFVLERHFACFRTRNIILSQVRCRILHIIIVNVYYC